MTYRIPNGTKISSAEYPELFKAVTGMQHLRYGHHTRHEKVAQGMVYFVDGLNGPSNHRGRVLEWFSPWTPDFTDGSFWRPSDCFLMIPPVNWECE